MELLYLYFSKHSLFAGQNFNFGGEFLLNYNPDGKMLDIVRNPHYVKGFYNQGYKREDSADVLNVTGIIAENGAGKTTLLNLIRDNFPLGKGGVQTPMMFAYKRNGSLFLCRFKSIEIKNQDWKSLGFSEEVIAIENKKVPGAGPDLPEVEYSVNPRLECFNYTEFIYFSNIFDGHYSKETKGLRDVSTNFLIRQDMIDDILNRRVSQNYRQNDVETFLMHDIRRQMAYVNTYLGASNLGFPLPEHLIISTVREYQELNVCFDSDDLQIFKQFGLIDAIRYLFDKADFYRKRSTDWKTKAEIYFAEATLMNYLYEISTNYKDIMSYVQFDIKSEELADYENFQEVALNVLRQIQAEARSFQVDMDKTFYETIKNVQDFIEALPGFIKEDNVVNGEGTSFFILPRDHNTFAKFYRMYSNAYILKPYLGFGWPGLSSGENAFMNILSRFYSIMDNQQRLNSDLPGNLVILIDEGDTYLHPTWQKKLLKELLDHLPVIFAPRGDKPRTIQIIFTTNSPIPATDLPNSNIIFLEKMNGKTVVKNSLEDKKLTFGANINTLLSDSFFLRDGALGDFAKSKINEIIELLQRSVSEIEAKKDDLEITINMIGEPIVKSKLLQMLTDRMTLNLVGVNKRISELEEEIKQLKGKGGS